ncbi:MAG: hypothetical protein WAT21_11785 [Saprospiraceae bacterium]
MKKLSLAFGFRTSGGTSQVPGRYAQCLERQPKMIFDMKKFLLLALITAISFTAFSQVNQTDKEKGQAFSYAYISVSGKLFSKKLKIIVDLGDSPEQIKLREEYSDVLTNRKSYAAILNYMVENEYELVETLTLEEGSSFQGTGSGGTSGVIFIMKRRK